MPRSHANRSLLLLFAAFALPPALHAAAPGPPAQSSEVAYSAGTRAMNEHRWSDAIAAFDRVAAGKGRRSDAALYWKAYSLDKLGKAQLAQAVCSQLRAASPESQWNQDCAVLSINHLGNLVLPKIPDVSGLAIPPIPPIPAIQPIDTAALYSGGETTHDPNADIKILALNSLLNRDPAQAIPLLRGVLTGDQSDAVKTRVVFVLEQSRSPEAQAILHDVLLGRMGPRLQRNAIQNAAVFQGKRINDTLAEVYRTTDDPQIKRSVITAFFISGDDTHMVEITRNERDLNLKKAIVSQLALMSGKAATDYMIELLK